MPGASPPAPLRLCLRGTGCRREGAIPRRGLAPGGADAAGGAGMPGGGLTGWLPVCPTFTVLSAPIPPTPFPAGRGRIIVFLCKGLRPLHPRGWVGSGTGGGQGGGDTPAGGLTGWLPVYPAFTVLSAPIPPAPFPSGEGGVPKFISPGASPPAPLRLCLCGTGGGREVVFDRGLARRTGRERWFSTIIIRSGKFWGGRGTLSRVPRRIPVSPRISAPRIPARLAKKKEPPTRGGSGG